MLLRGESWNQMNPLLLCVLSLVLLEAHQPSNPPAPTPGCDQCQDDEKATEEENPRPSPVNPPEVVIPEVETGAETSGEPESEPTTTPHKTDAEYKKQKTTEDNQRGWNQVIVIDIISTVLIAVATGVLAFFTWLQYELNKRAFYATNRPRLRVRRTVVLKVSPGPNILLHYLQTGFSVQYSVTNIGGTKAAIVQKSIGLHIVDDIGVGNLEPQWKNDLLGETEVPVGDPLVGISPKTLRLKDYEFRGVVQGRLFAYIIGGIRYKDGNGVPYETAFCRRFNPDTNRFERVENSDYEYED